ncbi:MFS transporter [Paenibacillus qinlingensis]|uniref:MFS family arabinose efflux permease n=1 Tax=Paenibacillus qinlingensis TaxID=1837343 RepID=A0ABU1P870_9BACL|nr:MFS transporter [Paenibacillus qinlingensis]MDR6555531.1 putative MFS family arabinose efflux permease [Paenibacillus qinlingensis]
MSLANAQSEPTMRSFFSNRFVQTIMLSGVLLQIGIWIRNFAILLYVTDMTNNDPYSLSLISVAEFAPIFIFSFIGGAFADRWRPRLTMVWCDLLSAASVFVILITLYMGSWKAIFFATLVSSILSQFSQPSNMKLFKVHVPASQMQMGMSMFQSMMAIFMILGPMLGSFIYYRFGIEVAVAIMGACFLLSAFVLTFLPKDRKDDASSEPRTTHIFTEMGQGFRYVMKNRMLVILGGCFAAAGLAVGLISPLGIFLVTEHLGLEKANLQWFMVANGAAMIVGGGVTMAFAKKITPQAMLTVGMAVSALTFAMIGMTHLVWLALLLQFVSGLVMPAIQIGISTLILGNTEESFVGRVNGILTPLFMGSMVITMSLAGTLKATFSLESIYLTSALLFVIGVLIMVPSLKMKSAPIPQASSEMK